MKGLYKSYKTKEARPLHLEPALPPGDAVPQTLPDGCVVLRHHLVDDGASRPGDGRQVGQGQHAHLEYNTVHCTLYTPRVQQLSSSGSRPGTLCRPRAGTRRDTALPRPPTERSVSSEAELSPASQPRSHLSWRLETLSQVWG